MRSRILIGASAWLLGAVAATTGSLYAVNQVGQGLIAQHSKQVTVAMVNAELALEKSERNKSSAKPSPSSPAPKPSARHTRPAPQRLTPSPQASLPATSSQLLTSQDGTAVAICKPAGAYLISWSPQQGFQASHVRRGPASVAKVTFANSSGGVIMAVTCQAGQPVAHLRPFSWDDSGHDD